MTPNPPLDSIELLPVSLLDQNRATVNDLKKLAQALRLEFGWHYLLDLAWILQNLERAAVFQAPPRIMDAGAGTGLMQWYLAWQGADVLSVDRLNREALSLRFRGRFQVQGLRPTDLLPASATFGRGFKRSLPGPFYRRWAATLLAQGRDLAGYLQVGAGLSPAPTGRVWIYNQDLADLADIASDSLDAVVAVSSLEHNTPEGLQRVVQEIMRTLKPGGLLLATLTAGRDQDWWHTPSSGWCYTDTTLRRLFDLPDSAPSNYDQYDRLLAELRDCAELRDNLASFYFTSNDKGMPGGVWDPQYQPVGVCKIKR
jgi:SAM-dependent methyltransferase